MAKIRLRLGNTSKVRVHEKRLAQIRNVDNLSLRRELDALKDFLGGNAIAGKLGLGQIRDDRAPASNCKVDTALRALLRQAEPFPRDRGIWDCV